MQIPSCSVNIVFSNASVASGAYSGAYLGATGPYEYCQNETLSNKSIDLTYRPYDENDRLSLKGPIKQVALLILQQVMERKELGTYTFNNGERYIPKNILWGPFIFDTSNLEPSIKYLNIEHSEEELQIIDNLIREMEAVKRMKAFL